MRWISASALLISLASMGVSVWTWRLADARADAAFQRREKALVDRHRAAFVKFCDEYGLKESPANAQTLEELLLRSGSCWKG